MTDTRGTFRLKQVRQDILNNEYVPIPSVWLTENTSVGYTKMYGASEWKFNFTTSTTTASTHLVSSKYLQAGTSNPSYAWFLGGQPGPISDSKKITYATDTAADNPSSRLPVARSTVGAISGETFSYLLGGNPGPKSTVSKLTHTNDTTVDLPGSHLASSKYMVTSGHGGGAHGYMFRGMPGPDYSTTERITFANDTRSTLPSSSDMDSWRASPGGSWRVQYWGAGNLQCPTHFYYAGGTSGTDGGGSSIFQKFTLSNETWDTSSNYLTQTKKYISGMTADSSKGYIAGGLGPGYRYGVDHITFATDTWATEPSMELPSPIPGGGQSVTYGGSAATTPNDSLHPGPSGLPIINKRFSDGAHETKKDYYYGGGTYGPWSTAAKSKYYKIEYSTDTHSDIGNSGYHRDNQGSEGTLSYSWVVGGYNYPQYWSGFSNTTKFMYSSDAISELPGSNLTVSRANAATMGDNTKIWEAGGRDYGQSRTDFEKATFSVGTWAALPGAQLNYAGPGSTGLRCTQAGGNKTTGYMCGGGMYSPPNYSRSQKITYSSDTVALIPSSADMTTSYRIGASASSADALYIINGSPGASGSTPKMTYSTETVSVITNNINTGTRYLNGTGNSVYGRKTNSPDDDSTSNYKIDYTTETWSTASNSILGVRDAVMFCGESVGGSSTGTPPTPTPTNTTIINTTPAPDVGYFTGGPHYSSTDKLNFTNDTMAAGAQMVTPRYNHVAWGNGTNFLDAGGTIANGADRDSRIEKITLSNNTVGALPNANMPNKKRFFVGATGNDNIGYIAGGQTPSSTGTSSILKITYATYTTDANPGCHLGAAGYTAGAGGHGIGSPTAAYIVAGSPSGSIGEGWHKVPYATNTATYTRPGTFDNPGAGRGDDQSTGNKDKGYVTGYNPGSFSTSKTTEVVFATDTSSNSTYSPNLGHALNRGATGNQTTGYFHGGLPSPAGGAGNDSYITKFVYASDTISQLPASGKMTVPRTHCDAGSGVENSHNLSANTALI